MKYPVKTVDGLSTCDHKFSVSQDWVGDDDTGGWEKVVTCDYCGLDLTDFPLNTRFSIRVTKLGGK